ncbi:MAG: molecular chaperone HtpG [Candidatus Melainabacteria bacterium HGW-Melainabacteria-1]|nr:MAG: molecular chaperone HtpG [Candidatus Melainabacteria bacterium HGW-Melainabacteria-1]
MSITAEKGTISVHMENIFPIVKKALYNDKEIFLRELVSNAVDAINKFRHLQMIGEAAKDDSEFKIQIRFDKEARQLSIIDNGLGLTAEEVKKYINEVAFSSAHDFMERFKDQAAQIIGHFGLGFYSAFMVAEKVEIHSLSYLPGADPVLWSCDGSPNFEMMQGDKAERGTEIRLTLMNDELDFAEEPRLQHLIRKYCDFMPYPIMLGETQANKQEALWNKNPKEVTDQEYLDFYHYFFPFAPDPHLWIHLNVEVPFNLRGILFFPKLAHEMDSAKGQIKLFANNVFVSDQSEEFLPRFLMTLQGGIDCPDIPLNVSRSMLQNDPYVQRVSSFITRKVADRLKEMFNKDRDAFVKTWDDIHTFIKFGVMEDDKFYDKIKDVLLFKSSKGDYLTLEEYAARHPQLEKKVYYTSEESGQQRFVDLLGQQGIETIYLNTLIDTHFIQFLEYKNQEYKFARVDSDIAESLVDSDQPSLVDPKTNQTGDEALEELFKRELGQDKLTVKVQALKTEEVPALIVLPEQLRRLYEMTRFMQGSNPNEAEKLLEEHTLVVNSRHPLLQTLRKFADSQAERDTVHLLCEHLYDLAMLAHKPLRPEQMDRFMGNANKVLQLVAKSL